MNYEEGQEVLVWTGAATGTPYPPRKGDRWDPATIVEVKRDTAQIAWVGQRPGMPWVPSWAIKEKPHVRE